MKILVIGAGINGILTGYLLAKKGFRVEILEESDEVGTRTTFANGCQLSFSHTTPMLILPSIFQKPFNRPLCIPKTEKDWLRRHNIFKNSFNERFHILTNLSKKSKQVFEEIITEFNDLPEQIGHSSGTIFLFQKKKDFIKRLQLFDIQKANYNIDFKSLSIADAVEYDASLANISHKTKHAIFTPFDKTINAFAFTKFLAEKFENLGGKIHFSTKIHEVLHKNGEISSITTNNHNFEDYGYYVYCAGASGLNLLRKILPDESQKLQEIQGYSMTFDVSYSNYSPDVNIIDFTNKMVYSRHGNFLRVAGFFDLPKVNKEKRMECFYKKALETFPVLSLQPVVHKWCESRVFSDDEIPLVQKFSKNFIVNTGQGHLGVTLSAGSAKKVSNIIQEL